MVENLEILFPLALLTGVPGDPLTKSPVELHRLPIPVTPFVPPPPPLTPIEPTTEADRFCKFGWRGEGDGAGEIEWLLIESEWSEPFEWWIAFWARLLALAVPCEEEEDMALREGELVTRDGTRPKRFSSTLEFNLVMVFREKRKLLLDMTELLCDELFSSVDLPLS